MFQKNKLLNDIDEFMAFFLDSLTLSQGTSLHKKCFPLRISSVNMTKSAESCGFGHIY